MGRIDMGDNFNTLIGPIGIAEHGMALAVFIDHKTHGLICEGFDFLMQRLGQKIRAAAIDHHDPIACEDEAQIVVMSSIFIGRGGRCADGGKDMGDHLHRF